MITDSVTLSPNLHLSTGRAADVARRLIHDHDIREAREVNQNLVSKGKEAKQKLKNARKLTAMLNFNTISCKGGEDSLKIRLDMTLKKNCDEKVQQKKNKIVNERKSKYEKILTIITTYNGKIKKNVQF